MDAFSTGQTKRSKITSSYFLFCGGGGGVNCREGHSSGHLSLERSPCLPRMHAPSSTSGKATCSSPHFLNNNNNEPTSCLSVPRDKPTPATKSLHQTLLPPWIFAVAFPSPLPVPAFPHIFTLHSHLSVPAPIPFSARAVRQNLSSLAHVWISCSCPRAARMQLRVVIMPCPQVCREKVFRQWLIGSVPLSTIVVRLFLLTCNRFCFREISSPPPSKSCDADLLSSNSQTTDRTIVTCHAIQNSLPSRKLLATE